MRNALKNKQDLMYSNLSESVPQYLMENGEIATTLIDGVETPVLVGYSEHGYTKPEKFIANITPIGSETYARHNTAIASAYGIDIGEYEALILLEKGELPLTETSYIWHVSKPKYKEGANEVDVNSADYKVERVATSKNVMLVMMRRVNHNDGEAQD